MVQGLATAAAIVLVFGVIALLGWLVGGGSSRAGAHGVHVLRYGKMFRGLAVLAAVVIPLILGIVILVGLLAGGMETKSAWIALAMAGGFFLLGFPLTMEGFRRQITLDEAGITGRGWFGGQTHIPWGQVEEVSNRVARGFFLVRGGGKKIKLGHYLDGLDQFAQECQQRLPAEVWGNAFAGPLNRPFL
jgi:hypothetical protein